MRRIGIGVMAVMVAACLTAGARSEGREAGGGIRLIGSFEELRALSEEVAAGSGAFTEDICLTADIEADGPMKPIGSAQNMFLGTFDGQEHTVSGLCVEGGGDFQGLFGYVGTGGVVRNLVVERAEVSGKRYVGGIAAYSSGRIEGCVVSGSRISAEGHDRWGTAVGGIAGVSCGTISRCASFGGTVSGVRCVGGIAGNQCYGELEGCASTALVVSRDSGQAQAGGIAGSVHTGGTVRGCISAGRVSAPEAEWVGGVVGALLSGRMTGCMAIGSVSGRECGAAAGYAARRAQIMMCRCRAGNSAIIGEGRKGGVVRMWGMDEGLYRSFFNIFLPDDERRAIIKP